MIESPSVASSLFIFSIRVVVAVYEITAEMNSENRLGVSPLALNNHARIVFTIGILERSKKTSWIAKKESVNKRKNTINAAMEVIIDLNTFGFM